MSDPPSRLLLVRIENSCRSQMVGGFARSLGKDRVSRSADGTEERG